jgi:hypothetical protein
MRREIYVVVAERDCIDPFDSYGPIVFETNIAHSSPIDALKRARDLGQKYGQVKIGRLEFVGTPDEFEQMLKGEIL